MSHYIIQYANHVKGAPLSIAKTIFIHCLQKKIDIKYVIVGQHGDNILQTGMLEFIQRQGFKVSIDENNRGQLIIE